MTRRTCDVKVLFFISFFFFALPVVVTFLWNTDLVGQGSSQDFIDLNNEINELVQEISVRGPGAHESYEDLRDIERRAWDAYSNGRISEGEYKRLERRIERYVAALGDQELWAEMFGLLRPPTGPLPPPPSPPEGEEPEIPELPPQPQEPPPPEPGSSPTTEAILKAPQKKEGVAAGEAVATVTVKEEQKEPYPPVPLQEGLKEGALALAIDGTGTTTRMACTITNKTSDSCTVVIPTGTPLEPGSKDHQPYQTGYIPPIPLEPGETKTVEVPAFCTDSEKEPAPSDGSVTYALHEGPLTPEQEKITEIIVVTNTLRQIHETCGKVAEPDDFLVAVAGGPPPVTVPTPREFPKPPVSPGPPEPEPEVYGPPPPPPGPKEGEEEKPPPSEEKPPPPEEFPPVPPSWVWPWPSPPPSDWWRWGQWERDNWLEWQWLRWVFEFLWYIGGPEAVRSWFYSLGDMHPLAPEPAPPEGFDGIPRWYGPHPRPEDFEGISEPPPRPPELPPGMIELPPGWIILSLSGPLEFPGTTQFTLAEVPELRTNISSRKEKGEAIFSNPTGKVAVSLAPTEDPNIVKFDITKLEALSPSFKALDKSRGDINVALNSPEKSTGTLNIKTGEVRGTVSAKAWGKKYKEPFPAAATYTGKFDFPTKKLSLNLSGTSFEPVDLEEGLYQRIKPEKFWDSVMLYSIWKETNDQGKEELKKVMTEQLRADFPKERAEGLAALVAEEIVHRVDEVHDRHKKLKKEEADFSILDPTLKLRKT